MVRSRVTVVIALDTESHDPPSSGEESPLPFVSNVWFLLRLAFVLGS